MKKKTTLLLTEFGYHISAFLILLSLFFLHTDRDNSSNIPHIFMWGFLFIAIVMLIITSILQKQEEQMIKNLEETSLKEDVETEKTLFCTECGNALKDTDKFCNRCGKNVKEEK